ncbi:MAG: tRNA (adenosine(37)-N6)-dimethylallyltransferase MiaA [Oscillospiraceae bacterium]|nr:tRNA (adenosine(37)-N6)-dimethylallyltransferase MiaA [Ruminococcus sp.]MCD8345679.1 tRNA (adenosine(37)-N6)-dimethylallyltransferase MiaA [Oscillospiraceae bacterium]
MKQKLIVVCGPTASGKTELSVSLAEMFDCEIVSADSMQIYRDVSIATAKPTKEEMRGIRHHMIDILDLSEEFSVADYVRMASECIEDIASRGKTPLVCGGTGLYISSLINGFSFDDTCSSTELREELSKLAEEKGGEYLLDILREFDPESAARLHPNNLMRIIRAIEVYKISGVTMTEANRLSQKESPYDPVMIGLNYSDRELLYERVNLRVDRMLEMGLLEEAKTVLSHENVATAGQAIGYKEFKPYFSGEKSLEECVETIKQDSRRYAKRQLTWFRRDERINWILRDKPPENETELSIARDIIRRNGITEKH